MTRNIILTERWNLPMLLRIVNSRAKLEVPGLARLLMRVMESIDPDTGELRATYKHAKSLTFGRLYAYPSMQSVSGWIRRLCAHGLYHDIDIENCFPVILSQVAAKHGLGCPHLDAYVQNREQCFELVKAATRATLSRKQIKECFIRIIHNGDYRRVTERSIPFLDGLEAEVKVMVTSLMEMQPFEKLTAKVLRDHRKDNKRGTFVTWVCQRIENDIIQAAKVFFETRGRRVDVLVFDGLMVVCIHPAERFPEDLLRGAGRYVLEKTGYCVKFTVKSLEPTEADVQRFEGPRDRGFFADAIEVPDAYVRDIEFPENVKAVLINAAMGLGKSTAAKRYLRQYTPKRVLYITARRQQAHTLLGDLRPLQFKHYQQYTYDLASVDRLIIQYESLHRLTASTAGDLVPYDLIVVDEIRAVAGQVCSLTNKDKLPVNAMLFKALLQSSRCLLMDADLEHDCMVKVLADEIWTPGNVQVYRYTHIALQRQLAPMSKEQWVTRLKVDLLNHKKIMAVFRTKREMDTVLTMVTTYMPNLTYLAFSSDSTEEDMKAFQNINEQLQDVQLLCFTSKVTVGADIQVRFDAVYMNAVGHKGCCARDMFQMIGRARNVTDPCIRVTLPDRQQPVDEKTPDIVSFADKLQEIHESHKLREKYAGAIYASGIAFRDGKLQWTPNWIIQLLACSLAENDSDFTTAFLGLARRKQYEIVLATAGKPLDDEDLQAVREAREEAQGENLEQQEAMERKALDELQARDLQDLKEQYKRLQVQLERGTASPADRVKSKLARTCLRFPRVYKAMNFEHIQEAAKNILAINKLWWLKNAQSTREFFMKDSICLQNASIPELAKLRMTQLQCTQRAVQQLGFYDLWDVETQVSDQQVVEHAGAILRYCELAARFENRRERGKTKCRKNRALNALRRELGTIGYQLVSQRLRQDGERVTLYRMRPNEKLMGLAGHADFPVDKEIEEVRLWASLDDQMERQGGRPAEEPQRRCGHEVQARRRRRRAHDDETLKLRANNKRRRTHQAAGPC